MTDSLEEKPTKSKSRLSIASGSGQNAETGSAVLLAIFISAIVITVAIGFNWLVKEHMKSAGALKDKADAIVRAHSAYGTFIFSILTGQLLNNQIMLSDKLILGITYIPINNTEIRLADDVSVSIQDSNGRISLANGAVGAEMGNLVKNLDGNYKPSVIVDSINDWLDPDDSPSVNGAEADYYLSAGLKYKPRNSNLRYLGELMLVSGIDSELYDKLIPYITILPTTGFNPNTASPAVLRAFLGVSKNKANEFNGAFRIDPITSFETLNQMAGTSLTPTMESNYFVPSNYFDVRVSYSRDNCNYSINAGIGLQDSGTTPYSTYYWKES